MAARGKRLPTDDCAGLFIDQTNVLWVGTTGVGIRTYDLQPNPFQTRRYGQSFYLDLLTSGLLGLPAISPSAAATLHDLNSYNFRSTFNASGNLCFNVGSSDIYRLNLKTKQMYPVPLPCSFHSTGATPIPCTLATDPQGHVWAIYIGVTFWYDAAVARWIRFPFSTPLSISDNMELVVDDQALGLASRAGGLWHVDRRTGQTRQFTNHANDPTTLSSNSLYCVSADPADCGSVHLGTGFVFLIRERVHAAGLVRQTGCPIMSFIRPYPTGRAIFGWALTKDYAG